MATKDQAYALFLLSLPLFLLLWFAVDRLAARKCARDRPRPCCRQSLVALLLVLLVDGAHHQSSRALLKRIAFLTGPASGDYAEYLPGPAGWLALAGRHGALLRARLWRCWR